MQQNVKYNGPWHVADKTTIAEVINLRNIKHLVHFTRCNSVDNICSKGILPVKDPDTGNDTEITQLDLKRRDNRLFHVSLSVTRPNIRLYYNKWKTAGSLAFILLDPELLEHYPALFFYNNAACDEFLGVNYFDQTWNSGSAFEDIFPSNEPQSPYPCHPQAELQVLAPISPKWIIGVSYSKYLNQQCFDTVDKLKGGYPNITFNPFSSIKKLTR